MTELVKAMLPEIVLCTVACVLLLMGVSMKVATRRLAPVLALLALIAAGVLDSSRFGGGVAAMSDARWHTVQVFQFARYVKLLSAFIGVLLVLLAWPTNRQRTGGPALDFSSEGSEFFALILLCIAGIFIVAGANDIMLLFLGIELASIPTYIMVVISRPLAVAQEAGVKYFFLGAMAAALMLFGFSYLYGTTGTTKLDAIAKLIHPGSGLNAWQLLAVVMLIAGFAFKMAVVPLHFYAGDVYQGAATPVTALLSFVPKITGFVALLKVLYAVSGGAWSMQATPQIIKLLWVLAVLTMSVGNILGLVQANVKRLLAYSSIAHSGYMLVGVTALIQTGNPAVQTAALAGVLFYLTAYGITNVAAFGVLILLPSRQNQPATSAETFEDLAGMGRQHILLGLAMAVSCFSLIGIPLTVGFFGKFFLILPAWRAELNWLVIILVANAAVSAAYYLRIVATLFMGEAAPRPRQAGQPVREPTAYALPALVSVAVSMVGILYLGTFWPATNRLETRVTTAASMAPVDTASLNLN